MRYLYGPEGLKASDTKAPSPGENEVVLAVRTAWCRPTDLCRSSHSQGQSGVGIVRRTGAAATALAGMRVLFGASHGCGECKVCRRAQPVVCPQATVLGRDCDGAFAEEVCCKARWLMPLDERFAELSDADAAFVAGPLLEAYGLWCRAGIGPGDELAIFGAGPVARVLEALAATRGAKLLGTEADAGEPAPRFLFVLDGAELERALAMATPGSVIALASSPETTLESGALLDRALTLFAMPYAHPDLMAEALAMVHKGELSTEGLIEESAIADASAEAASASFEAGRCYLLTH